MRDDHTDLIEAYLGDLRARLRTPDAELVLAEAEDHLRESVAAGLAIGMSEREAREAAISAFGSVRAVVRAHNVTTKQVAADLVMTALKLGWIGMFRRSGTKVLPGGFFPLAASAIFTIGALALVVCTFTGGPLGVPAGPGAYLSGALVAAGMAAGYGARARRALRSHAGLRRQPPLRPSTCMSEA